ncbi:MAG: FAD-dependent oxidoreductase, partial [Actinomycetota bacterium]
KGEVLVLGPRPGAPCPVGRVVRTPGVYLVPRPDGRVVVGATQQEAGDVDPTAGAALDLLEEAVRVVPALREMALLEHRAGLRPAAPDALPVLGRDGDGLVWAAGGFRHGVLLTPVAARAAARVARGEDPGPEWAPFTPMRFAASREEVRCG